MTHVVLFGSSKFEPVWALLSFLMSCGTPKWIRILTVEKCRELNYTDTDVDTPVEILRAQLAAGEVCSLQVSQDDPMILFGLYAPQFCDERWNQWRCVGEGSEEDVICIYRLSRKVNGMDFVSHSLEEEPEIDDEWVTIETFPWEDWRLKRAAIRLANGTWQERKGPAS